MANAYHNDSPLPSYPMAWRGDGETYRYWQECHISGRAYCIWTRKDYARGCMVAVFEDSNGFHQLGTGESSAEAFRDACEQYHIALAEAELI
jgi:hypothetical protein